MTDHKKPLLAVEDALAQLLLAAQVIDGFEVLPLQHAHKRVLAVDITAPLNVPGFDNSAMDGYALRCDNIEQRIFTVSQRIAAGQAALPLQAGTLARIFTGAPLPVGADAVVMQEQCELLEDGRIEIKATVLPGQNIRRCGEDISCGNKLLEAGTLLRPQELGLLASIGIDRVSVRRRLQVAVFFTGDELVEPGQPLKSGQIYNSNRYMVVAMLHELGCQVTDLGIVSDSLSATRETLRTAASGHDVVLTCGGVSVGEEDHVKAAVQAEGKLRLWQIAIKPGKPLAFGSVGAAHFIGLPGNPVSSFVTFKVLVEPFLRALTGDNSNVPRQTIETDFDWPRADRRREYLRVRLQERDGRSVATLYPQQGSGVLTSCSFADGLLEVEPGQSFGKGEGRPYHRF